MKKKRKKQLNCSVAMSHWLALLKWGTDLLRLETVTCWVSGRCWFNMLYCHIRLMNLMCCIAAGHIFWLAVVSFARYQQHVVLHQAWRQYMEELIPSSRWVTQQAACCLAQGHKLCVWSTKYTSTKYSLCHCAVLLCTGRGTILVYSFGSLCCPFLFWSGTSLMYSLWHCAVPLCTGSGTILMYSFMLLCCPFVYWKWNNPDVFFLSLGCPLCARSGTVLMYSLCTRCGTVLMCSLCTRCETVLMYSLCHWAVLCVPEVEHSPSCPGVQSIHHVMSALFHCVCLGSLNSPGAMQAACQKLLKAELQGSMLKVQRSKCPSYVGISGIVLQESRHTFNLITPNDTVKCKYTLMIGYCKVLLLVHPSWYQYCKVERPCLPH